jgi:hypothetical protein
MAEHSVAEKGNFRGIELPIESTGCPAAAKTLTVRDLKPVDISPSWRA